MLPILRRIARYGGRVALVLGASVALLLSITLSAGPRAPGCWSASVAIHSAHLGGGLPTIVLRVEWCPSGATHRDPGNPSGERGALRPLASPARAG